MSDGMLLKILRMPCELAMRDEISRHQYWQRARQAADEIESLIRERDKARDEVERLRVENEELRKERDTAQANLFSLSFHFENWKFYNGTYVKEMQIEELRAEIKRLRAKIAKLEGESNA